MSTEAAPTITEFLLARIAEDEQTAQRLLRDLEEQIIEDGFGGSDERGPFTPSRMLSAQLWAHYDGQTRRRSFARGHQIATLADPTRALAECAAKREIIQRLGADEKGNFPVRILTIQLLMASVYSGHPDYQQEWAPRG